MKEGQKTLRVEGLDYVDDVEMFSLWTINRNKNCQKTSPNLVKMARGHEAYWEAGRPSEDWTISPSRSHEASPSTRFSSHYASGIAFANAENPMKKAGLVVLSAGVGGMLVGQRELAAALGLGYREALADRGERPLRLGEIAFEPASRSREVHGGHNGAMRRGSSR